MGCAVALKQKGLTLSPNPTGAMTATNLCPNTRWTRQQIRAGRLAPLTLLLRRRGLQLIELPAGNFELAVNKGLLLKDS